MNAHYYVAAILLSLIPISEVACAADWKYLTSGTGGVIVTVDVESAREIPAIEIQRPFTIRQIWVRMDFSKDKSVPYREKRELFNFNCSAYTSMTVMSITYNYQNRVVKSWAQEDYYFKYEPEAPDTIGYEILEFACGRSSLPRDLFEEIRKAQK